MIRRALLLLAAPLLVGIGAPGGDTVQVDPLTLADDDFARHRDAAEWRGLSVEQVEFREDQVRWRIWRIVNTARPRGPLWLVLHDNESGAFDAALVAVRAYGGTMVAVDTGVDPEHDGQRFNYAVDRGWPVDPNRNFDPSIPLYAANMLAGWTPADGPVIALHTNTRGFDTRLSTCNRSDRPGNGVISIRYCDGRYMPYPSLAKAWPFDDDDTLVFIPQLAGRDIRSAFCWKLNEGDFNIVAETVTVSDRSISNYAALHALPYLTLETLDSGLAPAALAGQRDRLVAMVDRAFEMCVPQIRKGG
ncbi:hypothetical protein OF829_18600 [Sphingomonas sp. LB-2]|uniref:hypothetical protein n=1 Tax=Sphingomonas caeni TaxID=2984949 RepID=UPI00223177B4|nr:hypothetical protein [Sphingomonas caeni]MCW3849253.1 hypothetical protein [Sphingomonas caeni]